MILTEGFYNNTHRIAILYEITGLNVNDFEGQEMPLLEHWDNNPFSSSILDHKMIYNGFTFYCVGSWEHQVKPQIDRYLLIHNRDKFINDILDDTD